MFVLDVMEHGEKWRWISGKLHHGLDDSEGGKNTRRGG